MSVVHGPPGFDARPSSWPVRRERQRLASLAESKRHESLLMEVKGLLLDQCCKIDKLSQDIAFINKHIGDSFGLARAQCSSNPFLSWCVPMPRTSEPEIELSPVGKMDVTGDDEIIEGCNVAPECLNFDIHSEECDMPNHHDVDLVYEMDPWSSKRMVHSESCICVGDLIVQHWSRSVVLRMMSVDWGIFSLLGMGTTSKKTLKRFRVDGDCKTLLENEAVQDVADTHLSSVFDDGENDGSMLGSNAQGNNSQSWQCEHTDADVSAIIGLVERKVEEHVAGIMNKLRDAFPEWPPIRDMSESEGCEAIRNMCCADITAVVDACDKLEQFTGSPEHKAMIYDRTLKAVNDGLKEWKLRAHLSRQACIPDAAYPQGNEADSFLDDLRKAIQSSNEHLRDMVIEDLRNKL